MDQNPGFIARHGASLSLRAFLVALLSAPFAAAADAPFAEEEPAPHVQWFIDAVGPALTFAAPRVVLYVWQLVVAAALTIVIAAAAARLQTGPRRRAGRSATIVALSLLALHTLGIVLESATFGLGELAGFAIYFPTTFLEPLVLCVAGLLVRRDALVPRSVAWAFILAPLALVASQLLFPQFPGGSAPGLALPWVVMARAGWNPQPTRPEPELRPVPSL